MVLVSMSNVALIYFAPKGCGVLMFLFKPNNEKTGWTILIMTTGNLRIQNVDEI